MIPTIPTTATDPRFKPIVASLAIAGVQSKTNLYFAPQDIVALLPSFNRDLIAEEFRKHERRWKQQTHHISSPVDKYLHASYSRIIGLGWPAVAHILRSLKKQPNDWFYALRSITGENPVPDSAAGDVRRMTDIWLKWGKQRGLV